MRVGTISSRTVASVGRLDPGYFFDNGLTEQHCTALTFNERPGGRAGLEGYARHADFGQRQAQQAAVDYYGSRYADLDMRDWPPADQLSKRLGFHDGYRIGRASFKRLRPPTQRRRVREWLTGDREELAVGIARHEQLRLYGLWAVSRYDLMINLGGSPARVLELALELTRNHVTYTLSEIDEYERWLGEGRLF